MQKTNLKQKLIATDRPCNLLLGQDKYTILRYHPA